MAKAPKIATYKGVDIYYNTQNGYLNFEFEGEREVKYLFEAEKIIDEPRWEKCDLKGFYLDHMIEYHIGLAKATRRDVKSGRPDWLYKGKYDVDYKRSQSFREDRTPVYPVTEQTKQIYESWKEERDKAQEQQRRADNVAAQLKPTPPIEDRADVGGHPK